MTDAYEPGHPYMDYFPPETYLTPTPAPTPEPTPEPTPSPTPAPAVDQESAPPVISVDELLEMLQGVDAAPAPSDEAPAEAVAPYDVPAVELGVDALAIIDAVKGMRSELILVSDQLAEIQMVEDHPLLTTPFEDYTVSEGLLLLLLLCAFLSACCRLLRGGFRWLRS